ncbi:MAG: stage IV sporulation protein A [Firmicutes bacterium]|nr:stage IV sporulation protein A [Bacillota bacterium]
MEKFDIFKDIAERTGGDIYIGVVGPVRTGKSTFIKRFMDLLVVPNISDPHERQRAIDALPQAAAGKTIMTTEPKFIPDDGIEITVRDNLKLRVRMVDCVGYGVEGALGYQEESGPRMVMTPWFPNEIPFQEAAEVGTRKVISEHSTLGLVVTTDGTITDIPRESYVKAEERVVAELRDLGKPFIVILNSTEPMSQQVLALAANLEEKYDVSVVPLDCATMTAEDVNLVLEQVLYEFPVKEVNINLPKWIEEVEPRHWLRLKFEQAINEAAANVRRLRDVDRIIQRLSTHELIDRVILTSMDMGSGVAKIDMTAKENLFYDLLEEMSGYTLEDKRDVIRMMKELIVAKREYDRFASALQDVSESGYGMVAPGLNDLVFEEPELIRQGGRFGVRLKAKAPSFHLLKADVETEVTPIIGTEKQTEELVKYMMEQFEDDPNKIWQSNLFGKPLSDLMREGISNKLYRMPPNAQTKLQETVQRIVNEGSGGLICIII